MINVPFSFLGTGAYIVVPFVKVVLRPDEIDFGVALNAAFPPELIIV